MAADDSLLGLTTATSNLHLHNTLNTSIHFEPSDKATDEAVGSDSTFSISSSQARIRISTIPNAAMAEQNTIQEQQALREDISEATQKPTPSFTYAESLIEWDVKADDYLMLTPDTHVLATGVAVVAHKHGQAHILLVQRSASDSYPGRWEVPGGSVDMNGETVLEAAARELKEETGLTVERFVAQLELTRFMTGKSFNPRWWNKPTFLVQVEEAKHNEGVEGSECDAIGANVRLDEKEHQAWLWASEDEVKGGWCGEIQLPFVSEQQQRIMLEAFMAMRWYRDQQGKAEQSVDNAEGAQVETAEPSLTMGSEDI